MLYPNKTTYDLISEACKGETCEIYHLQEYDDLAKEAEELFSDIEETDEGLYGVETVMVFSEETSDGERYMIECDSLLKFMDDEEIDDVETAMLTVAKYNELPFDSVCLLIEPEELMESAILEAKSSKNTQVLGKIKDTVDVLKMMKTKGIKVVKKKSKKSKSKKKKKK